MYLKSTTKFSIKRICPRNCYTCSHPVLGFKLHITGACSFLTNSIEKAERVEAGRWAELNQLRGKHFYSRALCFSYLTFLLAPLQHHTPWMGFRLPNFKCLQWFVSSQTCSAELYLRRKPFSLFTVEAVQPKALWQNTGRHQAGWVPVAWFCLGILCPYCKSHWIKLGFHRAQSSGKTM